jgi:hypothetical protein
VVKRSSTKTPSKVKSPSKKASSKAKGSSTQTAAVREVDGIFVDRQHLDHALSALVLPERQLADRRIAALSLTQQLSGS